MLDTFDALGIRATFFLVARDLEVDEKREVAEGILRRGHEIGNHSLSHRLGMTRLPMGALMEDLNASQQMFEETLDRRPVGFRSPGYDIDARLLRAVWRAGFLYDSSLLPTWWAPVFRMADWWVARRISVRKRQFGRLPYGRAPLTPYRPRRHKIRRDDTTKAFRDFWEVPITTTPTLRLPIGAGYVLMAGKGYFARALARLRARDLPVQFLIHGADVTDLSRGDSRVFRSRLVQPAAAGLALSAETKRRRVRRVLERLAGELDLMRIADWVRTQAESND